MHAAFGLCALSSPPLPCIPPHPGSPALCKPHRRCLPRRHPKFPGPCPHLLHPRLPLLLRGGWAGRSAPVSGVMRSAIQAAFPLRMPRACSVPDGGAARSSLGVILFGGEVLPSATIIAIHRVCPNGTPKTRPGPKSTPKMEMGNGTLIPHPNLCHQNSSNLVGTTESKLRQSPKIPNIKIRNHEQLTKVCVAFFGGHSMVRLAFCSSTDSVPFSGTTLFVASSSSMGGLTKPRT